MKINIIAVGKVKDRMLNDKIKDYFSRLGKGIDIKIIELSNAKASGTEEIKKQESLKILSVIPQGNFVIALDERGIEMNSPEFAKLIKTLISSGKDLSIIIGGSYGLTENVRKRADLIMALSRLTFPYELTRLILAEQIFRAFSIINRNPYHHY